jgi:hypothetical protein
MSLMTLIGIAWIVQIPLLGSPRKFTRLLSEPWRISGLLTRIVQRNWMLWLGSASGTSIVMPCG